MPDLVYRLRKHAKNGGGGVICEEAAAEIERLRDSVTKQLEEQSTAQEPVLSSSEDLPAGGFGVAQPVYFDAAGHVHAADGDEADRGASDSDEADER